MNNSEFSVSAKDKTFVDLHIHSKYSRACSKNLDFENLVKWARIKGLGLLGTGDFTHPLWLGEIEKLRDGGNGIYYWNDFPFILSGEISLIYTKEKGRRIHLVLLAPSIEVVKKINAWLDTKGRRDYDGRPIFGISCEEFVKKMKEISEDIEIIPGHAWTPYFGVFGSESGFNSLKEAFNDEEKNIHAIETGMSSSPEMNWRLAQLNNKAIVSFSDSHSFWPWRLGREATILSNIKSYKEIIEQIRENTILGTVETDPAYGKYHYDGHRLCRFSSSPAETKKLNGICPVCGKKLTIGVENRVEELTDQNIEKNANRKQFYKILPLHEIIALAKSSGIASKKNWAVYNSFIEKFGNEFNILLYASKEDLLKSFSNETTLIDLILKNRNGKIKVNPGYDGEYGQPVIEEQKKLI
ncbi:DNA helicase UvrD [Candidatus Pacearchaeota archaeon]|nr:DNA helicase UvrD [Candidatus Pacearchaeota archaeon]